MAIIEVSDQSFKQEVESVKKGLVLIDFWAPWCGPCKQLAPILDELDQEIGEHVKIVKVNIGDNPEVADRLRVMSLPTLMVYKNGKQADKIIGIHPKEQLVKWLKMIHRKRPSIKFHRKNS